MYAYFISDVPLSRLSAMQNTLLCNLKTKPNALHSSTVNRGVVKMYTKENIIWDRCKRCVIYTWAHSWCKSPSIWPGAGKRQACDKGGLEHIQPMESLKRVLSEYKIPHLWVCGKRSSLLALLWHTNAFQLVCSIYTSPDTLISKRLHWDAIFPTTITDL